MKLCGLRGSVVQKLNMLFMNFLQDYIKRLVYYKQLGDKTFEQLNDTDFHFRLSQESNSIEIIIKHLHGNMLSRFTNFLTEDGEKPWRNRDDEFESSHLTKEENIKLWNAGWQCVLGAVQNLSEADLDKIIYIRTEPLKVYDALLRQLAHYPYHVGQIITTAKAIKDAGFNSLSIPKGGSNNFNEQMKAAH